MFAGGTISEPTFQTQSCCAHHTSHVIGYYTLIGASVVHITLLDFQADVFTVDDELLAGFDLFFIFDPCDCKRRTSCYRATELCCGTFNYFKRSQLFKNRRRF